ncbi:nitrate/nitrite sensor protein NarX [mine drainage metagenome]|uniref:histidine kinase n=1 Tax=mine drainage metagenome TaxID=410659 RepID=A0A1J5P6Y6_9ZZZZ
MGAYRHLRELLSTFRLKAEENFSVALHKTALEYADRGSIQVGVHLDARLPDLSPNEEIHLLQIARESLANAVQHAQASSAEVFLRRNADGSASLVVEDDGVGIDTTEEKPMHYGLQIMQERAAHLCQGRLALDRREPRGTRVEVRFVPASSAPIQERRNHVAKVAV